MNSIQRSGMVTAFVSAIGLSALVSGAHAQPNCVKYGNLALKQAREYEQRQCGPMDARWTTDLKAHISWCSSVGPTQWRGELKKRAEILSKCTG